MPSQKYCLVGNPPNHIGVRRNRLTGLIEIDAPNGSRRKVMFTLTDAQATALAEALQSLKNEPVTPASVWFGAETPWYAVALSDSSCIELTKNLPGTGLLLTAVRCGPARLAVSYDDAQPLAGSLTAIVAEPAS